MYAFLEKLSIPIISQIARDFCFAFIFAIALASEAIQVQAVGRFGTEICCIIGRDKSAPFGAVIPGVAIIQAGIVIVVIATTTNRVGLTYILPNFPPAVKKKPPRPFEPGWSFLLNQLIAAIIDSLQKAFYVLFVNYINPNTINISIGTEINVAN